MSGRWNAGFQHLAEGLDQAEEQAVEADEDEPVGDADLDHLSIRVWPSDSTSSVFTRSLAGPNRVPSGWPVRMIRTIARTAR